MLRHSLADAPAWFQACAADNTRAFWAAHREAYQRDVREPLLALLSEVGEDPSTWRVYRPHRDTRFSQEGGPLKTFLGALAVHADGTGRYVQVDARGLLASSGMPSLASDQLGRWRAAVAGSPGDALDPVLTEAREAGTTIKSGYPAPLKRVPAGLDAAHARAELLRWKGIEAFARLGEVRNTPATWLADTWRAGRELCAWLAREVGPTALTRTR